MTLSLSAADWSDEIVADLLSEAIGVTLCPTSITRRIPLRSGTHPKSLVSIKVDPDPERWFFIKTGDRATRDAADPRGGVEYEGRVYAELLARLELTVVRCYGLSNGGSGSRVLVLEGLPRAIRMSKAPAGRGFVPAARWLGAFHRQAAELADDPSFRWLRRYDEELLSRWCAMDGKGVDEWTAAKRFLEGQAIPDLLTDASFIIHGEYYGKNVLFHDDHVYPVDWESAAVGPAELDLAMLIDGWDPKLREAAVQEYATARWQRPIPATSLRRLRLAEMLLHARWLTVAATRKFPDAGESRRMALLLDLYAEATQ